MNTTHHSSGKPESNEQSILVLFQEYSNNIRTTKADQWKAVYYALAVLGALVVYSELMNRAGPSYIFVETVYLFVTIAAGYFIWEQHQNIIRYRIRFDEIAKKIGGDFEKILNLSTPSRDKKFPLFFSAVLVFGGIFIDSIVGDCKWVVGEDCAIKNGIGSFVYIACLAGAQISVWYWAKLAGERRQRSG